MKKFQTKNGAHQSPNNTKNQAFKVSHGFQNRNLVESSSSSTSDLILNDGRRLKDIAHNEHESASSSQDLNIGLSSDSTSELIFNDQRKLKKIQKEEEFSNSSASPDDKQNRQHQEHQHHQEHQTRRKEYRKKVDPKKIHCKCSACGEKGRKIYVQAGFMGNGTKDRPYSSLALAQSDFTWKTLIIYYSNLPLDGGITLKHGQRIIGKGLDKPIITNTTLANNGGFGIFVDSGNVCMQNIHIDNTQSSGINYDNAADICIIDTVVSRANQAALTIQVGNTFNLFGFNILETASIQGQNMNDGITTITRVVIRDSLTGPGIYDAPFRGARRELLVQDSEITKLTTILPTNPFNPGPVFAPVVGIHTAAFEPGTRHYVSIFRSYFHDYNVAAVSLFTSLEGIRVEAFNGAKGHYKIKQNTIENLSSGIPNHTGTAIAGTTRAILANIGNNITSETEAKIACNNISEISTTTIFISGITWTTTNGKTKKVIKKNSFANNSVNIIDSVGGRANLESIVLENFASASAIFYLLASMASGTDPNFIETKTLIKENNFNGATVGGAITVSTSVPFNRNIIELKKNCFNGNYTTPTGMAALSVRNFSTSSSNVTIVAHYNNFVNYNIDILDLSANANFYVSKNWWGNPNGPTVISTSVGYTGVIDTSKPLRKPIMCPLGQRCDNESYEEVDSDEERVGRHVTNNEKKFMPINVYSMIKEPEPTQAELDQIQLENYIAAFEDELYKTLQRLRLK